MAPFVASSCPADCLVCDGTIPMEPPEPIDQGDNGNCDACGAEGGDRISHMTSVRIGGAPVLVVSYLCTACLRVAAGGT